MTRDDRVPLIQQNWVCEPERLNAIGDLPNLPPAVSAGIVRIRLQRSDWLIRNS